MIEIIFSGILFILFLIFSTMLGLIAAALALCLFYLVWKSCWELISLFIPKNYRKGGKFYRQ